MPRLTIFLARFIGLFALATVAAVLVRGNMVLTTLLTDAPLLLVLALISLAIGIAMIVGHNVWSGGALPVVVTLVGWWILAKGALLLILTPDTVSALLERIHFGNNIYVYLTPAFVIGLYLTWSGFSASARKGL